MRAHHHSGFRALRLSSAALVGSPARTTRCLRHTAQPLKHGDAVLAIPETTRWSAAAGGVTAEVEVALNNQHGHLPDYTITVIMV